MSVPSDENVANGKKQFEVLQNYFRFMISVTLTNMMNSTHYYTILCQLAKVRISIVPMSLARLSFNEHSQNKQYFVKVLKSKFLKLIAIATIFPVTVMLKLTKFME